MTSISTARKLPPTPHGSARDLLRNPLAYYRTLSQEYGDLVCYRSAPEPAYLVNHPDFVRHVLIDNNRNYSKETYSNHMFKTVIGDGLLTSEGEVWRRQRRLMQPAFHHTRLEKLDGLITGEAQCLLERWAEAHAAGEVVDIAKEMATLTLSITTQALFGIDLGETVQSVGQAVDMGADLLERPRHPRFQAAIAAVEAAVHRIIAQRREHNADTGDLLSMLMQARDEETGQGMDDVQLRNQVITLLLAGYETTATALTWTWYLLSQEDEAARRMRAELAQKLAGRAPTYQDVAQLDYTRQVFEESLRLYPPAWVLGRKALGDDEIGGYYIPAGSILAISPYTLHRHPAFWSNPDGFDPERFLPERSAGRHRFAYLPFGAGPRQCIGNGFALLEAPLILATVAQSFALELVPGQEIRPDPLFILRPDRPVMVRLRRL